LASATSDDDGRDAPAKVLKDRRSPRERGRMGTSVNDAREMTAEETAEKKAAAAAATAADAPEAEPSESRREAMGVSDRPEGAASIEVQEGPFKGFKGYITGNNTNGSVEARLLIFGRETSVTLAADEYDVV
jgi:transcription antitermination factor NusG